MNWSNGMGCYNLVVLTESKPAIILQGTKAIEAVSTDVQANMQKKNITDWSKCPNVSLGQSQVAQEHLSPGITPFANGLPPQQQHEYE